MNIEMAKEGGAQLKYPITQPIAPSFILLYELALLHGLQKSMDGALAESELAADVRDTNAVLLVREAEQDVDRLFDDTGRAVLLTA